MTARTPSRTRFAHIALIIGLAYVLFLPAAAATPVPGTGSGSTRTVTWFLNDTTGLSVDRIASENGSAVLDWTRADVRWTRGPDFAANGALAGGASAGSLGIELAADPRNYVSDGDFAALGPWALAATPNVSVVRDSVLEVAYLGNVSAASPQTIFNSMDQESDPNWTSTGSSGSTCNFVWVPDPLPPGSMIRCTVTLGSPPGSYAGLVWPAADWSGFDRLVLSLYAADPFPLSWSFQLTALVGGVPRVTPLQPIRVGEQEISVNLTTLGPDLSTLTNIRFLIVGQSIQGDIVDFDDMWLTNVRSFDETGRVRQSLSKAAVTAAAPGSANLSFDFQVVGNEGVDSLDVAVNLSGSQGSRVVTIPVTSGGIWTRYSLDFSSTSTAAGIYSVEFSARIVVNSTGPTSAAVRIDNVRLEFPNRQGGSFLSRVIDSNLLSQIPALRWAGTIPSQTSAIFRLRTGNESEPAGPTWSAWTTSDTPGAVIPGRGPSRYLQLGIDLSTTNASRTPVVQSVEVDVLHRSPTGSIETSFELRGEDSFGSWTFIQTQASAAIGGGVSLFVDGGNGWTSVGSDGRLSQASSNAIAWRVVLATSSGLETPVVDSVVLTYELSLIPRSMANILLNPYLLGALVAITVVGYSTYTIVQRRSFALDDVFLVSKEGRLLMHNTRRMRPDRDEDILSGMLTAIVAFVKDSDPEGNGELHHFKVGDRTTVLERGNHAYVAAVYSGRVPSWATKDLRQFMTDVEDRFGSVIEKWSGDPDDLQGLPEFTARFVSRMRYRPLNGITGRAS